MNPEALGEAEKKLWKKIEPILCELLDELKANGKTEVSLAPIEMKHLNSLIDNYNQTSTNHNLLVHLADKDKSQCFLEVTSEFSFNESKTVNLYFEVAAYLCVLSTELFKVVLLFYLRDVDQRASHFSTTMEKVAPHTWKKLKPYIDNPFRNSLAHGTWAVENKEIILFEDAELVPFARLTIADFMIRGKEQSALYACLNYVIRERVNAKFFT